MSNAKQTLDQRRAEIDALIAKWEKLWGKVTYGSQEHTEAKKTEDGKKTKGTPR